MPRIIFLFLLCIGMMYASTIVTLRDSSEVCGEFIRLGDIALIDGTQKHLLDTLIIGVSSAPGHTRFVLKGNIAIPVEKVVLKGPARVRVRSCAQVLSYDTLVQHVQNLLRDSLRNDEMYTSELIFEKDLDHTVVIESGEYEVTLGRFSASQLRGRVMIPLVVSQQSGNRKTRVSLQASVRVFATVCVAKRDIMRGEVFSLQDFELRRSEISTFSGTPLYVLPNPKTHTVSGIVRTGTIVNTRQMVEMPAVETGSVVTIVTWNAGATVVVSLPGRARESGNIGDIIAVENVESNRIIQAKVIRHGLVEIVQGGQL